jgi:hypothetical protein
LRRATPVDLDQVVVVQPENVQSVLGVQATRLVDHGPPPDEPGTCLDGDDRPDRAVDVSPRTTARSVRLEMPKLACPGVSPGGSMTLTPGARTARSSSVVIRAPSSAS